MVEFQLLGHIIEDTSFHQQHTHYCRSVTPSLLTLSNRILQISEQYKYWMPNFSRPLLQHLTATHPACMRCGPLNGNRSALAYAAWLAANQGIHPKGWMIQLLMTSVPTAGFHHTDTETSTLMMAGCTPISLVHSFPRTTIGQHGIKRRSPPNPSQVE
jgi:hypothetical protein